MFVLAKAWGGGNEKKKTTELPKMPLPLPSRVDQLHRPSEHPVASLSAVWLSMCSPSSDSYRNKCLV